VAVRDDRDEIEQEWRRKHRIELETPRLLMRPLRDDDADWLAELLCDTEVARFLWECAETPEKGRKYAAAFIDLGRMRHRFGMWSIQDKESAEFHGWAELSKLRPWSGPSDEIALSYVLRRASWGRGIATEAAGRLLRHAFEVCELEGVMAVAMRGNVASKRVLKKIGMRWVAERTTAEGVELDYFRIEAGEFTTEK
jgi:RimJ/RimL family protein N-acetyltransferase